MAEMIIGLVIVGMVAGTMIIIGISNLRSKKPVGFYTGDKPLLPGEVSDVKKWNRRHGWMWIIFGSLMMIAYVLPLLLNNEKLMGILYMISVFGGIVGMMGYHGHIKKRFILDKDNKC